MLLIKKGFLFEHLALLRIGIFLIFFPSTVAVHAQPFPSFSASYDVFPYQNFKDPKIKGEPGIDLKESQIQSNAITLSAAYPRVFSKGRTFLVSEIYYQRREFGYKSFTGGNPPLHDIHTVNFTLGLQHSISPKWTILTNVTPGLASDFESDVSSDDFYFETVLIFIRQFGERFSFGFGAAYSTQFGEPIPMPVLAFDWNNGKKLSWSTILPVNSEFWYQSSDKFGLGLVLGSDGNNYHGDPVLFGVANTQLRYSVMTFGPSARYHLSSWLQLTMDTGFIGFHRFEFYDSDFEEGSFNMKPSIFFRFGLIGMLKRSKKVDQ